MMRRWWLAGLVAALCACGGAPPVQHAKSVPAAAPPKPLDEGRRFPLADQTGMRLVDDHLLGKDFLPGGNVAEYKRRGRTYQQFLVHAKSAEAAALLMFEYKGHLRESKYLPHMGGYFGMDAATPVYLFQKGAFLAGLAGLPEKEADPIARQFAARLN